MTKRTEYPIDIVEVTYMPGVPKNRPRWAWKCACDECKRLPDTEGLHGPFKTRKAAERDAVQLLTLYRGNTVGTA